MKTVVLYNNKRINMFARGNPQYGVLQTKTDLTFTPAPTVLRAFSSGFSTGYI
jgi:hypothetical protein